MNREVHVRNCEGVGVKLPRATRLWRRENAHMPTERAFQKRHSY